MNLLKNKSHYLVEFSLNKGTLEFILNIINIYFFSKHQAMSTIGDNPYAELTFVICSDREGIGEKHSRVFDKADYEEVIFIRIKMV